MVSTADSSSGSEHGNRQSKGITTLVRVFLKEIYERKQPRHSLKMSSDPDFLHLVETNRLGKNGSSRSNQQKIQAESRAYMNEKITLQFEGSTTKVPRFRLDKDFVQNVVNRVHTKTESTKPKILKTHLASGKGASPTDAATTKLLFTHLRHRESNKIIMSDTDLKRKCLANVTYEVMARAAIRCSTSLPSISSSKSDYTESHYDGDVLFVIHDVPMSSQQMHEVTENDVKRWIVRGAIRNTEMVDVLTKKKETLKQNLLQIGQQIASLPPAAASGGKGRVASAQNIRDKKAKSLAEEKERQSALLSTTSQSLDTLYAQHMNDCILSIQKRSSDENGSNTKTCDWAIQVIGDGKETYNDLIEKNNNWSMIPMYAFGAKAKKRPISMNIPEEDQSRHFVDTGEISMTKLPHGFGIFESYDEFHLQNVKTRTCHTLFHGQFHEGQFSEGTLYSGEGVFTGKFNEGRPSEGTMEYEDGIKISGNFSVSDTLSKKNPYYRALPDGVQTITFPDKAMYEGHMKQGHVTGTGVYKDASSTLSGQFQDGALQHDGGNEGKGYSNLHLSLMFDGERLWGPNP